MTKDRQQYTTMILFPVEKRGDKSMHWMALSFTLLLFQAGARVQLQQPQQTSPKERASLQGFVVKLGTGVAVGKAVVTISPLNGGRSYSAATERSGQFTFQNLEPGPYRLSAAGTGYVRSEYNARSPNRPGLPITLSAGQRLTQLVLQITPAGTITGRVFDRDGEPLANVEVQALKYSYQEGQPVLNNIQTARTNDLGEYRLFWLQPGQYYVSATPPQGQQGYTPVYYPGTTDARSAAPINLQPGVVFSGADLTLVVVPTLRITGHVIDGMTGQPVRNANIVLIPGRG